MVDGILLPPPLMMEFGGLGEEPGWVLQPSSRRPLVDETERTMSTIYEFNRDLHTRVHILIIHLCISENRRIWVWSWCLNPLSPGSRFLLCSRLVLRNACLNMTLVGAVISCEELPAARAIIVVFFSMYRKLLAGPL